MACAARSASGIKDIRDVMNGQKLILASMAPGTAAHDIPLALREVLGANFHLVPGYTGAGPVKLALERQEVDGVCGTFATFEVAWRSLLEDGTMHMIATFGEVVEHPWVRGVVRAEDLTKTEADRQLLRVLAAPPAMNRPFVVGPGVPRERVDALRRALGKTFADPQFLADATKAGVTLTPRSGGDTHRVVEAVLATPPEVIERLRTLYQR
jgi:tripartite-type tricarboxylate transporter receptor subunit TctC